MKKSFYILLPLVALVLTLGFWSVSQFDPNADVTPVLNSEFNPPMQMDTNRPAGFYPTLFNFNYGTIVGMNAGTVGAMYVNGKYYFNRWNSTDYYVYNNAGPSGGPGTQVGTGVYTGSTRDLTTDGRYIYAGKSTTQLGVLYRLDTGNLAQVTTFSIPAQDIRALTWDNNRKGFWCTGFSGNLLCKDSTGATKQTITSTLTGKYGMGWDSTLSQDSAWVWVWNQETSGSQNGLYKYHAASGTLKATYLFTLTGASVGIAGGAEVVALPGTPPMLVLLCNYQNFALVGYKMKDILTALEQNNEAVRDFKLNQNYPNPFNPNTNISFVLTKAGVISLDVYDAKGQYVKSIFNGYTNAGDHEYVFDASNLSSGVYFYTITVGDYKATKKMLLVK